MTSRPQRMAAPVAVVGLLVAVAWGVAGVLALDHRVDHLHRIERGEARVLPLEAGEHVIYAEHRLPVRGYGMRYEWSSTEANPLRSGSSTPLKANPLRSGSSTPLKVAGPAGEPVPVRRYDAHVSYRLGRRDGLAVGAFRVEHAGPHRVLALNGPQPAAGSHVAVGADVSSLIVATVVGPATVLLAVSALAGTIAARGSLVPASGEPTPAGALATAASPKRPESLPEMSVRTRWQPLAMWLAALAVLAWLVAAALQTLSSGVALTPLVRQAPQVITQMAVPAAGVWLVSRRDVPHVPLGLAVVATWGAVVHLPALLGAVIVQPLVHQLIHSLLAVGALVSALLALRARWDRYALEATAARTTVALAIGVWGVALVGGLLLRTSRWRLLPPDFWGPAPFLVLAGPLLLLLVLLVIAAVVWRRASLTAIPAAVVVTASAWTVVLTRAVQLAPLAETGAPAHMSQPAGFWAALLVEIGAAALLTVATARLTRAGRA